MSTYKFDKSKLLEATNGGLDIILHFYPEADRKGGSGKFPHFKTKDATEDHASAIIFETREGVYMIKHFGGGDDMTPFDLVIQETGLSFYDACKWIADTFNVEGLEGNFSAAEIEMKPATKNQKPGDYYFKYNPKLSDYELAVLGPKVTNTTANDYRLKSCKYFIQIKQYPANKKTRDGQPSKYAGKKMQIITRASETYPILVFEQGKKGEEWQKIYQPLNKDKGYRFRYAGNKPDNFLFGKSNIEFDYEPLPDYINEHNKDEYDEDNDPRADVIIIAGGDRDALNAASLGYPVVWKNSETQPLSWGDYKFLRDRCKKLCYVGDLDATGVKETVKIALQYIDLHIVHLPQWLKNLKYRGTAQKDLTDYCKAVYKEDQPELLNTQFKKLINDALPARFWDSKYTAKGGFKGYDINNEAVLRFLNYNGFYQYKDESLKDPFYFVRVQDNIITKIYPKEIKQFPAEFIRQRKKGDISLLNYAHRSTQLKDTKLATDLAIRDFDFSNHYGPELQCFFFKNQYWEITPNAIKTHKYGNDDVYVWDNQIIDREIQLDTAPIFKIFKTGNQWDIKILRNDNPFFNYLINTARVHWQVCGHKPFVEKIGALDKDADDYDAKVAAIWAARDAYREANKYNIAEEGLTAEQIAEQKLHLVNRIFAFGFAIHNYKQDSKAWSVYAMDDRVSDVNDSNGGTGKSLTWHKALEQVFIESPYYKYINGGDKAGGDDKFFFDGVTKQTNAVIFDDLDSHFPFRKLYAPITGEFPVNTKFASSVSIKYKDSPKLIITSNFGIYGFNESTTRRLLYTVYSDYYHVGNEADMLDEFTVNKDLGFDLWRDFDAQQWNGFFAFCAQACQFQMTVQEKINPPMGNVKKRNAKATIGDAFSDWADIYFEDRKNILVVREHAYKSALANGIKGSNQRFKKMLEVWCSIHNYTLNPKGSLNSQGHCKHHVQSEGKTVSCIYVQTPETPTVRLGAAAPKDLDPGTRLTDNQVEDLGNDDKDDLPF